MPKHAPTHDYYAILGIAPRATGDDIKRAYRALIARHHPDRHYPDDTRATAQGDSHHAPLINEAYQTLKDPAKRARYDALYLLYFAKSPKANAKASPTWGQVGAVVGRLIKNAEHNFRHNLHDLRHQVKNSDTLKHARYSFSQFTEKPIATLPISLDVAMLGGQASFSLHGQIISTNLPQGLHDGALIKLIIQDKPVWLSIAITPPDDITLDKKDIHRTVTLYPWQLALDEWLELPHFGQTLRVAMPAPAQLDKPIKLGAYGIPATPHDGSSRAGDLYLHFKLILPDVAQLSDEQRRAFEQLQAAFDGDKDA